MILRLNCATLKTASSYNEADRRESITEMAKPEIRAVKKNSNQSKESSQKQETQANESLSPKQAPPEQSSSSEPVSPSNNQSSSSSPETLQKPNEQQKESSEANQETTTRFFQAVGVIEGEVTFNDQGEAKVTVSGKTYPLLYIPGQKYKLLALQKHINQTGNPVKRLIVYPRAIHFPDKNKPQQIQFQLLKFEEEAGSKLVISQHLANMEFQIAGLWQFIPVCRVPCISVFKNFSQQRLNWIKQADVQSRIRFMKPAHLPVLWKQAPVKPFKYNPRAEKQEKPAFVKIKAKFLPSKDAFGFDSLLETPTTDDVPKYLKVSKKDKQQAQQGQAQSSELKQNGHQPDKEQKPDKQQKPQEKASTSETPDRSDTLEDTINRIAQQMENRDELTQHKQAEQAAAIAQHLISHQMKDEDYSLPTTYISNWKRGKNVPNPASKHYPAYRLWQLIINPASNV